MIAVALFLIPSSEFLPLPHTAPYNHITVSACDRCSLVPDVLLVWIFACTALSVLESQTQSLPVNTVAMPMMLRWRLTKCPDKCYCRKSASTVQWHHKGSGSMCAGRDPRNALTSMPAPELRMNSGVTSSLSSSLSKMSFALPHFKSHSLSTALTLRCIALPCHACQTLI